MTTVESLAAYEDERGNRVEFDGETPHSGNVSILFRGSNNVVRIAHRPRLTRLKVVFDCDNGTLEIGKGGGGMMLNIRIGQDSTVRIGEGTTSTDVVAMSATEGTTISVGKDVMFASQNQLRADDGHPIFDVRTEKRVNVSRDITLGNHVWLGWGSWVMGGASVGDGTVIGTGSIVTKKIPNNAIAVGVPARVVRKDIAWERPHLSLSKPFYKPDASTITKSRYWNLTVDGAAVSASAPRARNFMKKVKRRVKRFLKR